MSLHQGKEQWPLLALLAILSALYYPAFTHDYAKLDTFVIFSNVHFDYFKPWTSWVAVQGRPITSLLTYGFFSSVESIFDLQWIRFFSFIGTLALAFAIERNLKQYGFGALSRFSTTLLITSSTGVATLTLWTVCFPYNWAAAFSVWAGQLLCKDDDQRSLIPAFNARDALGLTVIFFCLLIYQPSALFCLLPIAIKLIASNQNDEVRTQSNTLIIISKVLGVLGLYYVLFKFVYLKLMPPQSGYFHNRLEAPKHLTDHVITSLSKILPQSLESWSFFAGAPWSSIVPLSLLLFLVLGLLKAVLNFRKWGVTIFLYMPVLGAIALVPAFYLSDEQPYYRMLAAFDGLIILLLCFSLVPKEGLKFQRLRLAGFTLVACLQAAGAAYVLRHAWVQPATQELQAYDAFFESRVDPSTKAIIAYPASTRTHGMKHSRYLFGRLNTSLPWVMEPVSRLLISEHHGKAFAKQLIFFTAEERFETTHAVVVNADHIVFGKPPYRALQPDALHPIKLGSENLWISGWLGIYNIIEINEGGSGTLNHLGLGRFDYQWEGEDLLIQIGDSWYRTNAHMFPQGVSLVSAEIFDLLALTKAKNP